MSRTVLWPILAVALGLVVGGCTVRPLYSDAPITPDGITTSAAMSSVYVKPVNTRYAQEVRNRLIFLLGGGQGQPTSPAYELTLTVLARREISTVSQTTSTVNEPTSASMIMYANYDLVDKATGKRVKAGSRQIAAAYDIPRQEFAAYRAQIDAENRAGHELAQLLQLAIAQDLVRYTGE
jgi:LPS-assembly lipoprotein